MGNVGLLRIILIVFLCCFQLHNSLAKDLGNVKKMKTVIRKGHEFTPLSDFKNEVKNNAAAYFPPKEYRLDNTQQKLLKGIFAVPQANAVATFAPDDSVRLIKFSGNSVDFDKFGSLEYGGEFAYLRNSGSDFTAFAQTRGINLLDFKTGEIKEFSGTDSISEYIKKIWIADDKKRHLLVQSKEVGGYALDKGLVGRDILRLIDFSGEEKKVLRQMVLPAEDKEGYIDFVELFGSSIFAYRRDNMRVYDLEFKEKQHPVAEQLYKHKEQLGYHSTAVLAVHTDYPIAWVGESDKEKRVYISNWVAYWGENSGFDMFLSGMPSSRLFFSPDGKWLVCSGMIKRQSRMIAIPISEKLPHYLGRPILLGDNPEVDDMRMAFTHDPVGVVLATNDVIYKWDLPPVPEDIEAWNKDPQPFIDAWIKSRQ
ncbi:MAG: hypothetical protein D6B28_07910 [Gammaproteobacteria bacterium]|nr:MAG: hypothetical protein D6B28_07910 [Gammaproteobacteria bacterium]